MRRKAVYYGFVLYLALMMYLLFLQRLPVYVPRHGEYWKHVRRNVNFTPFRTVRLLTDLIKSGRNPYLVRFSFINLIGNVVMFVPLGFFLPARFRAQRRLWLALITSAAAILLVEAVQALTLLGSGDIDDLILNMAGVLAGYAIWSIPPVKGFLE